MSHLITQGHDPETERRTRAIELLINADFYGRPLEPCSFEICYGPTGDEFELCAERKTKEYISFKLAGKENKKLYLDTVITCAWHNPKKPHKWAFEGRPRNIPAQKPLLPLRVKGIYNSTNRTGWIEFYLF